MGVYLIRFCSLLTFFAFVDVVVTLGSSVSARTPTCVRSVDNAGFANGSYIAWI